MPASNRTLLDNTLSNHSLLSTQKNTLDYGIYPVPGTPDHARQWIGWYSIRNHLNQTVTIDGDEKRNRKDALEDAAGRMLDYVKSLK